MELAKKGSWDEASCTGYWSDEIHSKLFKIEKQTVYHQLLLLAMKLVKMLMDKE